MNEWTTSRLCISRGTEVALHQANQARSSPLLSCEGSSDIAGTLRFSQPCVFEDDLISFPSPKRGVRRSERHDQTPRMSWIVPPSEHATRCSILDPERSECGTSSEMVSIMPDLLGMYGHIRCIIQSADSSDRPAPKCWLAVVRY